MGRLLSMSSPMPDNAAHISTHAMPLLIRQAKFHGSLALLRPRGSRGWSHSTAPFRTFIRYTPPLTPVSSQNLVLSRSQQLGRGLTV